jgi:hypothetical protein
MTIILRNLWSKFRVVWHRARWKVERCIFHFLGGRVCATRCETGDRRTWNNSVTREPTSPLTLDFPRNPTSEADVARVDSKTFARGRIANLSVKRKCVPLSVFLPLFHSLSFASPHHATGIYTSKFQQRCYDVVPLCGRGNHPRICTLCRPLWAFLPGLVEINDSMGQLRAK